MASVREALARDMKAALRAKESLRLSAIRMVRAEILHKDKEGGAEASPEEILRILQSMIKKREEAATHYAAAGRGDLAQKERDEMRIIQAYLPAQMDDAEIRAAARAAVRQTGASSMKDMGRVMGILRKTLAGRASGARVSRAVKDLLGA